MTTALTVVRKFHIGQQAKGQKQLRAGRQPSAPPAGRIPRISRFMALAIRFEGLIHAKSVVDQADLARLGHVSRARVSQIMNLGLLAPDIQEALLYLPRIEKGRQPVRLQQMQPIALELDWAKQRQLWRVLIQGGFEDSHRSLG